MPQVLEPNGRQAVTDQLRYHAETPAWQAGLALVMAPEHDAGSQYRSVLRARLVALLVPSSQALHVTALARAVQWVNCHLPPAVTPATAGSGAGIWASSPVARTPHRHAPP